MADISVLNTTAQISGRTLLTEEGAFTLTGLHTFDRDPAAPFAVSSGSAVVSNLDADLLDGQEGSFYRDADNLNAGTVPTARLPGSALGSNRLCEYRLSLTTGVGITTADVTAATTLYWTPVQGLGNQAKIYDGSATWELVSPGELSLTVAGFPGGGAADTNYDIFVDYNGGTEQLVAVAWTDATNRATALAFQDNIRVRDSNTDHLYVGTVRLDGSTQLTDSFAKRHVWNEYNRRLRPMRVMETSNTWSSGTADVWRQFNNSTANQLDFVIGIEEHEIQARAALGSANTSSDQHFSCGIGLDSATVPDQTNGLVGKYVANPQNVQVMTFAHWSGFPGIGRHFLAALEHPKAATTFVGDNNADEVQSGIQGSVWA